MLNHLLKIWIKMSPGLNSATVCLNSEFGHGVKTDLSGAAKYDKAAADRNCARAQFNYALCLEYGKGAKIDLTEAARSFESAADQDFASAQENYAACLEKGSGADMDLAEAARYYKLAATSLFAMHNSLTLSFVRMVSGLTMFWSQLRTIIQWLQIEM
jgi:TPR repeat protein